MQRRLTSLFLLVFLFACSREKMQSTTVPKGMDPVVSEEASPAGFDFSQGTLPEGHPPIEGSLPPGHPDVGSGNAGMGGADLQGVPPPSSPERKITWTTPPGWNEKPGSGFRYASFEIPGKGVPPADLSVTVLDGEAGGLLSNVNRWRGQIELSPLSEQELSIQGKTLRSGAVSMTLVNFVSKDPLIENRYKKRVLAAVHQGRGKTWFFKVIGEDRLVSSAEPAFVRFLESVRGL